ncbi:MAG: PCRF domain-containing protein, partial [Chitinispirillaceae bacterium]|nr:PCRF domain-containing protein [Chitinispirillaceae bacterium]
MAALESRVTELEEKAAAGDFWNDNDAAKKTLRGIKEARRILDPWKKALRGGQEIQQFLQMALEENDTALVAELASQTAALEREVAGIEFARKMSG